MAGFDWSSAGWDHEGKPCEELTTPDGWRVYAGRGAAVIARGDDTLSLSNGELWFGPLHVVAFAAPFTGVVVWASYGTPKSAEYRALLAVQHYSEGEYLGEIAPEALSYVDLLRRSLVACPDALRAAPLAAKREE